MVKSLVRKTINLADKYLGLRKLMNEGKPDGNLLAGDRAIEWSWVVSHLPNDRKSILDLGCVSSVLTGVSARLGHSVTAVDLRDIEYDMPGVIFHKGDINKLDFGKKKFEIIINCSTIEHIGLRDRYGSFEIIDGDLQVMQKLSGLLVPEGRMILTIPVGRDAEYAPYHRIYGNSRLPVLLDKYNIVEEEFWTKDQFLKWKSCSKQLALETKGSESYYALGLFLLKPKITAESDKRA